jgi:hypothetical protein
MISVKYTTTRRLSTVYGAWLEFWISTDIVLYECLQLSDGQCVVISVDSMKCE